MIFDKTTLYAEAGGQAGDTGKAFSEKAAKPSGLGMELIIFNIESVQYAHNKHFILHHGIVNGDTIEVGVNVELSLKQDNRRRLEVHHSATHLLHAALRKILGDHAQQRGSQITHNYLRFDFNHHTPLTENNIEAIEAFVNERCLETLSITTQEDIPRKKAEKQELSPFSEKNTARK